MKSDDTAVARCHFDATFDFKGKHDKHQLSKSKD